MNAIYRFLECSSRSGEVPLFNINHGRQLRRLWLGKPGLSLQRPGSRRASQSEFGASTLQPE